MMKVLIVNMRYNNSDILKENTDSKQVVIIIQAKCETSAQNGVLVWFEVGSWHIFHHNISLYDQDTWQL